MAIKSFDQLKAAVEAVALKKYAAESSTPEDPNEVAVPATKDCGMISEKCLDVPEGKANDKAVEKETSSFGVKDSTEESELNPTEEPSEKVTEQSVAKRGSDLLARIQNTLNAKAEEAPVAKEAAAPVAKEAAAPVANIAEGISLSEDALAKIASEILSTEEGAKFTTNLFRKKAGEEYAAAAIKEATERARLYKELETNMEHNPIAKFASELSKLPESHQAEIARRLEVHAANMEEYEHEILKRAYAAGAEDAEAMMQDPSLLEAAEEPTVEEAGEAEITPEEVMEAVSEMVDAGEISEEQANEIVEEIVQGAAADEEVAAADEVAAEDEVAAADDAALADEAIAAGADEAGDAAALEAAAAEGPAKLASEIVRGTILLKKASADAGIVEDEEANIQDVVSVVQQLAEEGSISEEEAISVITEIAEAMESEGDEIEDEGEALKHDMEAAEDEVEATEDVADADAEAEDSEEEAEESEEDDEDAEEAVEKVASVLKRMR